MHTFHRTEDADFWKMKTKRLWETQIRFSQTSARHEETYIFICAFADFFLEFVALLARVMPEGARFPVLMTSEARRACSFFACTSDEMLERHAHAASKFQSF